jgi:uncharacterized protein YegJ (DUF2314 family)
MGRVVHVNIGNLAGEAVWRPAFVVDVDPDSGAVVANVQVHAEDHLNLEAPWVDDIRRAHLAFFQLHNLEQGSAVGDWRWPPRA